MDGGGGGGRGFGSGFGAGAAGGYHVSSELGQEAAAGALLCAGEVVERVGNVARDAKLHQFVRVVGYLAFGVVVC